MLGLYGGYKIADRFGQIVAKTVKVSNILMVKKMVFQVFIGIFNHGVEKFNISLSNNMLSAVLRATFTQPCIGFLSKTTFFISS